MRKLFKTMAVLLVAAGMFVIASCSNKKSSFNGEISASAKRTEIHVVAEFDKNPHLEDKSAKAIVRLYADDDSETFRTYKSVTLTNGISGSCDFTGLDANTSYVIKLFVTYDGNEYLIHTLTKKTRENGTSENAIEISNKAEFLEIADDLDAYYVLTAPIDLEGESLDFANSASQAFTGTLDGGNFTISNFKYSAVTYSGLFGYMSKATVKNLTLDCTQADKADGSKNSVFTLTVTPKHFGCVAGYAESSTIENVNVVNPYVTNTNYSTSDTNFGLFVGQAKHTAIKNCNVQNGTFTITSVCPSSSYTASVGLFAGSIVGTCPIENCYAEGSLTAPANGAGRIAIGGFAGVNDSSKVVENSYFKGTILVEKGSSTSKDLSVGGFVGRNVSGPCNLNNCVAKADIKVSSKSISTFMATELSIGGLVGSVTSSPIGIKNCAYATLTEQTTDGEGNVSGGLIFLGKVEKLTEEETTYKTKISLTIGKCSVDEEKIENIVACSDSISHSGIAEGAVEGVVVGSTITTNVSFLSDALQAVIEG